jgi:hypothetical protein
MLCCSFHIKFDTVFLRGGATDTGCDSESDHDGAVIRIGGCVSGHAGGFSCIGCEGTCAILGAWMLCEDSGREKLEGTDGSLCGVGSLAWMLSRDRELNVDH